MAADRVQAGGIQGEFEGRRMSAVSGREADGRLLVRDPVRRATVRELWTDERMCGKPVQGRLIGHNLIVTGCYSYMFMVLCNASFYMHLLDEERINEEGVVRMW